MSEATGDDERLREERLRRMRGRSALMAMASVLARSDGITSFEDADAGREKFDAVGVASSKLGLKARGVVGSGVRGR